MLSGRGAGSSMMGGAWLCGSGEVRDCWSAGGEGTNTPLTQSSKLLAFIFRHYSLHCTARFTPLEWDSSRATHTHQAPPNTTPSSNTSSKPHKQKRVSAQGRTGVQA